MNNIFENWNEYWFGYWCEFGTPYNLCPSATLFIDHDWDSNEKELSLLYVSKIKLTSSVTSMSAFPCVFHGFDCIEWKKELEISGGDLYGLSDAALNLHPLISHYICHHNIRVPNNIYNFMKNNIDHPQPNIKNMINNTIPYDYSSQFRMNTIDPEGGGYANRIMKEAEELYDLGDIILAYQKFTSIESKIDLSANRKFLLSKKLVKNNS